MNWITNYVRPRINSIFSRREIPENLWTKCDECGTMLFHRELRENLNAFKTAVQHFQQLQQQPQQLQTPRGSAP